MVVLEVTLARAQAELSLSWSWAKVDQYFFIADVLQSIQEKKKEEVRGVPDQRRGLADVFEQAG